jgi:hypothetical protein
MVALALISRRDEGPSASLLRLTPDIWERLQLSQYYEFGDETLWNPSSGVSRLFLRQVALFEEEVGLSSGIAPMQEDEAVVSPEVFEAFVSAVLAWRGRTHHVVVQALSDGFIATLVVLAERAGIAPQWPVRQRGEVDGSSHVQVGSSVQPGQPGSDWQSRVRAQARTLAGSMAR